MLASMIVELHAAGYVFAEDEAAPLIEAASSPADLRRLVDRRVSGFPLEHVLGWVEFGGLRIFVDAGVFVPRQPTAFLVQRAVAMAAPDAVVPDLCCGASAIGAAVTGGGHLFVESSGKQAALTAQVFEANGLIPGNRTLCRALLNRGDWHAAVIR